MNTKSFIMSTLAGAVTLFLLGFVFYAVLLMDFFEKAAGSSAVAYRQEPILWAIFLGEVASAALVTFIFQRWASIKTFATGAKGGAIIGVLISLAMGFIYYGTTTLGTMTSTLADVIISLIRFGLAGGVIGWVTGRE